MSGPFTHILVPVDGSEPSHRALKRARKLAEADGAELTVLEVVEPILYPSVPPYTTEDFVKELAEARYQQFKPLLESTTAKWNRLVREGFAADEICRVAEEEKCDLIAIGSRGLSAVERWWLGSVSDRVVHHAPCDVLVIR